MTFDPQELGRSRADLAQTLKDLRKRAGWTQTRLAQRCAMSQTKISNIESGKLTPTLVDVELILRALDAPAQLVSEIAALARLANTEWQDNWALMRRGLDKRQNDLAAFEQSSTVFRYFLPTMITGLLATPEYIRASLADVPEVQRRKTVAKKVERQEVLYDKSKRFTFILTEQAARWPLVSPEALSVQIQHLAALAQLTNVTIGVLPLVSREPVPAPLNVFSVYDERLATVEIQTGVMMFRDRRDVSAYLEEFSGYEARALFGADARAKLTEWADACR
ncbi:helix-turn-helix domain-containing protein [Streptomyces sp. TRM66268-LWL]|uniref:Helix-turn-helix domain-containing protein n=1 Tax=Streptomyces polyasparticus TaxID=2767826 RepID=A0ABR7SW35_9ACTN|nr:helix-turn-helix transcriptional regulator [Streptomyces polyasparticus]MBC9718989.1 helix-turn-helix domain-containing protein [Streptomyces polyasparticus]